MAQPVIARPAPGEYSPYHEVYVSHVPESDVWPAFLAQPDEIRALLGTVSPEREYHCYAEGKWSVREVVGHLADTERVFAHRAFTIAREDEASLPGFDENAYVVRAGHGSRSLASLVDEWVSVRHSVRFVLEGLSEADWCRMGTANQRPVSVRALAYLMVGHVRHHVELLRTRYGI